MKETVAALSDVMNERKRQNQLVAVGKLPWNCADPSKTAEQKYCPLGEEFGEIGKAIHEALPEEELRVELIQLAAVAVAWAESLPKGNLCQIK